MEKNTNDNSKNKDFFYGDYDESQKIEKSSNDMGDNILLSKQDINADTTNSFTEKDSLKINMSDIKSGFEDVKSETDASFNESEILKADLGSLFKTSDDLDFKQNENILRPNNTNKNINENEDYTDLSLNEDFLIDDNTNLNNINSSKKRLKRQKQKSNQKKLNSHGLPMNIIAVVSIISAIIGGVFGGISAALYSRLAIIPSEESSTETGIESGTSIDITSLEETKPPETLAGLTEPPSEKETENSTEEQITAAGALSAKEIYANSVDSVVGISGQITVNNGLWGQSKAKVTGSGFIISDTGYIVTNAHVVNGVDELSVTLYNKKTYAAKLIGLEVSNDIAVIKISAKNLTAISWGDSDSLAVGEELIIIGNPLGELTHSLTNGVVSALSRQIGNDLEVMNMFQTNAAINSGNSGGPVFDTNGKVVGIATSKYASSSIEGLSFCIPANDVKGIIDDIIKFGYAKNKPNLGVTVQTVTSSIASKYNIVLGAYVVAIDKNSAAAKAGLQQSDVIVELNGKPVSNVSDLQGILKGLKANQNVQITIYRSGSQKNLNITLDEKRPAAPRTNYSNVYDL